MKNKINIIIWTEIKDLNDYDIHESKVKRYINEGYTKIATSSFVDDKDICICKTMLEKPKRELRTKCNPVDDACDIKDKIKELVQRYKYNVATSTVALYEEFLEDLEELIK